MKIKLSFILCYSTTKCCHHNRKRWRAQHAKADGIISFYRKIAESSTQWAIVFFLIDHFNCMSHTLFENVPHIFIFCFYKHSAFCLCPFMFLWLLLLHGNMYSDIQHSLMMNIALAFLVHLVVVFIFIFKHFLSVNKTRDKINRERITINQ